MTASVKPDPHAHRPQPTHVIGSEAEPGPPTPPTPFADGFPGGMVWLPCEIRTVRVRQFYRRHFEQLSQRLGGLDRARNFRDVDPRLVDQAEEAITARLHEAHARCTEANLQADALSESGGLGEIPIHYSTAATIAVPIVHPHARRCLEVLLAADHGFAAIERLWLLGRIDTRQRRVRETVLRQALRSVASEVRQQYSAMARVVRGGQSRSVSAGRAAGAVGSLGATSLSSWPQHPLAAKKCASSTPSPVTAGASHLEPFD